MLSIVGERAISHALEHRQALLKFISPNDSGQTKSHQCGFYLPNGAWQMFTTQPPQKGLNHKHDVSITWHDGSVTDSVITWYGLAKHEYRLTRFGYGFKILNESSVGNLLVLIPVTLNKFYAYVLDLEEDINEIQAALGVEVIDTWGVYRAGKDEHEVESNCLEKHFNDFAAVLDEFPTGKVFSEKARLALTSCIRRFPSLSADKKLMRSIETEYALYRLVEKKICGPLIQKEFKAIDDFLKIASSIMNRRKSRAGQSFENHVAYILKDAEIPFESQPAIDGKPDIVIPSVEAYHNTSFPKEKLFVIGLKTTCKDRWRQVLNEGKRVDRKHLMTMQRGISVSQLKEMADANVSLIVPKPLHSDYPSDSAMKIQDMAGFVQQVKETLKP